jgi:hypothetical protein
MLGVLCTNRDLERTRRGPLGLPDQSSSLGWSRSLLALVKCFALWLLQRE